MRVAGEHSQDHLGGLDLLRLAAALAVVFFHFCFRGSAGGGFLSVHYPAAAPFALFGYLGVNLFFLISGYVIAWSAEGRNWERFAVARFARLYPGYLVCMTVTFVVLLGLPHAAMPVSVPQYIANLTMFAPALGQPFMDGAYWSIVLEIIFYGWMTLALMTGVFPRYKLEMVAAWLAISLINETVIGSGALRFLLVTEYAPYFAAGILVRHIQTQGRSPETLLLLAGAFLLSCNTMQVTRDLMLSRYGTALGVTELVAANLVIHALLIGAIKAGSRIRATPSVIAAGGITYPLYLLHQHIGYTMIDHAAPLVGAWPAAILAVSLLLALAWIVWALVETPAQRQLRQALDELVTVLRSRWKRKGTEPRPGMRERRSGIVRWAGLS